jgi:hypothetical protein
MRMILLLLRYTQLVGASSGVFQAFDFRTNQTMAHFAVFVLFCHRMYQFANIALQGKTTDSCHF